MLLAILFAVTTGIFYWQNATTVKDTTPVATVNGDVITKAAFYDQMLKAGGQQTLDQMITETLVMKEAQKQGVTATDADVQNAINGLKAQYGGDTGLAQAMAQANITMPDLQARLKVQETEKALVKKTITYTDADLQKYLAANPATFGGQPEQVCASHILVADQATAQAIHDQLAAGADFATLAKAKSTDTGSATKGGDLGCFTRDKMVKEFADAAFTLKVGEISQPVKSQYGYHIIKVTDHKPAVTPDFASVKTQVQAAYVNDQLQTKVTPYLDNLKKNAKIDNKLFPSTPSTPPPATPATGQ